VLQALSDALADLPAVPAPTLSGPSRGTAEVERLLAGRSWGPAALRALVGRMSRSPALQETMLRLVLTHRMDDDLADLLTDLDETTRTWSSDGGRGSDGALRRKLHNTSGGSSETAANELAVRPSSLPSGVRVVITATPVAKRPSACRKPGAVAASPSKVQICSVISVDLPYGRRGHLKGQRNGIRRPSHSAK
jgi:hypothetical protein